MIKSITVTNHLGDKIKMVLKNPEQSGFLVQSITGLGPGSADINTTDLSSTDGSVYNSSRIRERNIVFTFKLMFDPMVEDTRHLSYKYFPLKKNVHMVFETDRRLLAIDGRVESNEPDIFSQSETTQISLICTDPYFHEVDQNVTSFSNILPLFEFPFCNDSLEEPQLLMGEIQIKFENLIPYYGDSETGVIMVLHFIDKATNITIYKVDTREIIKIDTAKAAKIAGDEIKAGDDIIISTVVGDKYAILLKNGVEYNVLNCIDRKSDWFALDIGDNSIAFTAEEGATNIQLTILNDVLYSGV